MPRILFYIAQRDKIKKIHNIDNQTDKIKIIHTRKEPNRAAGICTTKPFKESMIRYDWMREILLAKNCAKTLHLKAQFLFVWDSISGAIKVQITIDDWAGWNSTDTMAAENDTFFVTITKVFKWTYGMLHQTWIFCLHHLPSSDPYLWRLMVQKPSENLGEGI